MDIKLNAPMDAPPAAVLAEVTNLLTYPEWHGMVHRVEPDGEGWLVDLGGKVGPFSQSKRVRLVRATDAQPGTVRFVRSETDGEDHSGWVLEAMVDPPAGAAPCMLTFRLHYDGSSPLIGMVQQVLRAEVERSAHRLRQRLAAADAEPPGEGLH